MKIRSARPENRRKIGQNKAKNQKDYSASISILNYKFNDNSIRRPYTLVINKPKYRGDVR